jgi:hypothetical protein
MHERRGDLPDKCLARGIESLFAGTNRVASMRRKYGEFYLSGEFSLYGQPHAGA